MTFFLLKQNDIYLLLMSIFDISDLIVQWIHKLTNGRQKKRKKKKRVCKAFMYFPFGFLDNYWIEGGVVILYNII